MVVIVVVVILVVVGGGLVGVLRVWCSSYSRTREVRVVFVVVVVFLLLVDLRVF